MSLARGKGERAENTNERGGKLSLTSERRRLRVAASGVTRRRNKVRPFPNYYRISNSPFVGRSYRRDDLIVNRKSRPGLCTRPTTGGR